MKEALALSIVDQLHKAGFEAYFAGGCVRDRLRGVEPKDFDIVTSATPEQIQSLFPKTVPVGVSFGVILVVEDGQPFEVATFRADGTYEDGRHPKKVSFTNVQEDAKRRDFTVNGLYWDTVKKKVLDFVGGEADIRAKKVRAIGDPDTRFNEDSLRMVRAVRFSVQLGFEIDSETFASIGRNASLLARISQERIRDELVKTLTSAEPARGLRLLDETKLLPHMIAEVETLKGVEQPSEYHPEGDVYVHTLLLLEGLSNAPIELAMAALLHDIAKPATFVRAPDRIRFHGHDKLGAEMSRQILRRLTFPNSQIDLICELVLHHLRFKDAFQMRTSTLKRFLGMDRFDLHLELHRLDCMASHKNLDAHKFCMEKYKEFLSLPPPPLRLVTGEDLIQLGVKPGPEMGKLLREIEDAILEGEFSEKSKALEWVMAKLKS